jgi:hypothetical protein
MFMTHQSTAGPRPRRRCGAGMVVAGAAIAALAAGPAPAVADGPGVGTPAVVQVGDSVAAGEGGRWAGNTKQESWRVDALGAGAYNDAGSSETIPGCHRSRSAPIHIGGGVQSANLACSGAKTFTYGTGWAETFKPGIDFYADTNGRVGQALALQRYAATHNVKAVFVTIGANNYGFGDVVGRCVWNFISSWWSKNFCSDDDDMTSRFTSTRQATETNNVFNALMNIRTAMANARYSTSQYSIIVQTYWSPIPRGSGFRYSEDDGHVRQDTGGCGFYNRDADWANDVVVPVLNNTLRNAVAKSGLTNATIVDVQSALAGRRLCENTVGLVGASPGPLTWTAAGAVDRSEWVAQIRTGDDGPYKQQESLHASYWGQLAVRNCLRQAYNGGAVRGGRCQRTATGLNDRGEPQMGLY